MSTLDWNHLRDLMRSIERQPRFDTVLLPPSVLPKIMENRLFSDAQPSLLGMRVLESPEAKVPTRRHKRRRWMSDAYHRRIQKKWNKRFGFSPAAFLINTRALEEALSFRMPLPPIRLRDLSFFDKSIVSMLTAV